MKDVKELKSKEEWVRCRRCGHKLFKVIKPRMEKGTIEIKCHSCKSINVI